jgi:hypothetical protein
MTGFTLQGMDKMVSLLGELKSKSAKKAAKSGINAGLAVIARAARNLVNSMPLKPGDNPDLRKDMRSVLGKKLFFQRGEWMGKAGVFRKGARIKLEYLYGTAKAKETARRAAKSASAQQAASGFGNPVWWVLGTKQRMTGKAHRLFPRSRSKEVYYKVQGAAAHRTGRIVPRFPNLMKQAVDASAEAAIAAMAAKVEEVLAREAAKGNA